MADATTAVAPPAFQYTPPPDFAGTQDAINSAYTTALAKTQAARAQLYSNAGFVNGTGNIDQNNQFGQEQQILQGEGAQLSADDANEESRGLGLDSGLGAQQATGIRTAAAGAQSNLGVNILQNVAGYNQDDADAAETKRLGTNANNTQSAAFDSQTNAYNDALAAYIKMVQSSQAPPNGPNAPSSPTYVPKPGAGYNPNPSVKPGKVTVNKGQSARAL